MENLRIVCGQWRFAEALVLESGEAKLAAELEKWPGCNRVTSFPLESLTTDAAGVRLPFDRHSFDLVVVSRQLQYFERVAQLLKELARVGSFQAIEVPVCDTALLDVFAADLVSQGVANVFTPSLLRFQLHRAGLEVLSDRTATHRNTASPATGWLSKPRFLVRRPRLSERSYTVLTHGARPLRVVGE